MKSQEKSVKKSLYFRSKDFGKNIIQQNSLSNSLKNEIWRPIFSLDYIIFLLLFYESNLLSLFILSLLSYLLVFKIKIENFH